MTELTLARGPDRYICRPGACVRWMRKGQHLMLLGPLADEAAQERFVARREIPESDARNWNRA